jgi:hypothetical protein
MFMERVLRIQWLAQYYFHENSNEVRRNGQYDPNNPWYTLGMIQRQRLAREQTCTNILMFNAMRGGNNKTETVRMQQQLQRHVSESKEVIHHDNNGVIVIPAASCINPSDTTGKVQFMPSFLGGQQLLVKDDAELEYRITTSSILPLKHAADMSNTVVAYYLSCRVATAHRSEQPIQLTIGTTTHTIPMPYTMALWGTTEPIRVELDLPTAVDIDQDDDGSSQYAEKISATPIVLCIQRPKQNFGFAFKDIQLTPI